MVGVRAFAAATMAPPCHFKPGIPGCPCSADVSINLNASIYVIELAINDVLPQLTCDLKPGGALAACLLDSVALPCRHPS